MSESYQSITSEPGKPVKVLTPREVDALRSAAAFAIEEGGRQIALEPPMLVALCDSVIVARDQLAHMGELVDELNEELLQTRSARVDDAKIYESTVQDWHDQAVRLGDENIRLRAAVPVARTGETPGEPDA